MKTKKPICLSKSAELLQPDETNELQSRGFSNVTMKTKKRRGETPRQAYARMLDLLKMIDISNCPWNTTIEIDADTGVIRGKIGLSDLKLKT